MPSMNLHEIVGNFFSRPHSIIIKELLTYLEETNCRDLINDDLRKLLHDTNAGEVSSSSSGNISDNKVHNDNCFSNENCLSNENCFHDETVFCAKNCSCDENCFCDENSLKENWVSGGNSFFDANSFFNNEGE